MTTTINYGTISAYLRNTEVHQIKKRGYQMKQTVKTSRAAGYLEKMFRTLNADLFDGQLEEPVITIQSTPRAYGHVTIAKAWKRREDWRHELNIGAETLSRPIEETVATMVHEMVHLWNLQVTKAQDCSRGGTYHNKVFKEEAEKRLLKIEKHPTYGGQSHTRQKNLSNTSSNKGGQKLK